MDGRACWGFGRPGWRSRWAWRPRRSFAVSSTPTWRRRPLLRRGFPLRLRAMQDGTPCGQSAGHLRETPKTEPPFYASRRGGGFRSCFQMAAIMHPRSATEDRPVRRHGSGFGSLRPKAGGPTRHPLPARAAQPASWINTSAASRCSWWRNSGRPIRRARPPCTSRSSCCAGCSGNCWAWCTADWFQRAPSGHIA